MQIHKNFHIQLFSILWVLSFLTNTAFTQGTTPSAVMLSRNIVEKAANVELNHDSDEIGDRLFALENSLDSVALARQLAHLEGLEVLAQAEHNQTDYFRTVALKMVKFGPLSAEEKKDLLKRIINSASNDNEYYVKADAATKLAEIDSNSVKKLDLGTTINASLRTLKRQRVEMVRYWLILQALHELSLVNKPSFSLIHAQLEPDIRKDFSQLCTVGTEYIADSQFYGITIFKDEIVLPESILQTWCNEWLCPSHK